MRPPNPHKRIRNSLRFSEAGALAKCNKGRERRDLSAWPGPRETNPKWADGHKRKTHSWTA